MTIRNPEQILEQDSHCGLDFVIIHNGKGFRQGYIRLPADHPWYGISHDKLSVKCHGGLTFSKMSDDGYWIGFDCCHADDAPDPELVTIDYPEFWQGFTIRTQEYVLQQCRSICEQARRVVDG